MFKKIGLILVLMLCLCACKQDIKTVEIDSFKVDMSGYRGLSSTKHNFKQIKVEELFKVAENKASGIFYLSSKTCGNCQIVTNIIQEAAFKADVSVYYIDTSSSLYPINDYSDELKELLYSTLLKNDKGERSLYTPHLFALVNGEIKGSEVGLSSSYDESEAQRQKLIDRYYKIMLEVKE